MNFSRHLLDMWTRFFPSFLASCFYRRKLCTIFCMDLKSLSKNYANGKFKHILNFQLFLYQLITISKFRMHFIYNIRAVLIFPITYLACQKCNKFSQKVAIFYYFFAHFYLQVYDAKINSLFLTLALFVQTCSCFTIHTF